MEPTDNSFLAIFKSPYYWIAMLSPAVGLVASVIFLDNLASSLPSLLLSDLYIFGRLLTFLILPHLISFIVNYFVPFVTNFKRVLYCSLPYLSLLISAVIFNLTSIGWVDEYIVQIYILGVASFILSFSFLFGWLGARTGIRRGKKLW